MLYPYFTYWFATNFLQNILIRFESLDTYHFHQLAFNKATQSLFWNPPPKDLSISMLPHVFMATETSTFSIKQPKVYFGILQPRETNPPPKDLSISILPQVFRATGTSTFLDSMDFTCKSSNNNELDLVHLKMGDSLKSKLLIQVPFLSVFYFLLFCSDKFELIVGMYDVETDFAYCLYTQN